MAPIETSTTVRWNKPFLLSLSSQVFCYNTRKLMVMLLLTRLPVPTLVLDRNSGTITVGKYLEYKTTEAEEAQCRV
jgi:hypothetical protein